MIFEVSATEDFSCLSKMLDWFRIFSDIFVLIFVAFGSSVFRFSGFLFLQVFEVFDSGRFETRIEQCNRVRKVSKIADFTNRFLRSKDGRMGINEISIEKSEKLEKFLK